jgi:hypothetical protein
MRNGKAINAFGEPVLRTDFQAFVPYERFVYRSSPNDGKTPKDVWIGNVVQYLKQIASEEFQYKGWVNNEIHEYCTFVETCCGLFDDIDIEGFFEHAKEFGFSDIQYDKIFDACKAFKDFSEKYSGYEDPLIIVKDPEFPKVRQLAQEALESMGITYYLDPSKQIFKDMLLSRIYWISDPEMQKRTSFMETSAKTNPFEELMHGFFNTAKASTIILNHKDYEITDDQVIKLKDLYQLLEAYREKVIGKDDLQEILDDPKWHQIQALADDIVKLFDYKP